MYFRFLPHVFLLVWFLTTPSWANSLKGKVTDPSDAAVAAARVTIKSSVIQVVKTTSVDPFGTFVAEGLDPGTYP